VGKANLFGLMGISTTASGRTIREMEMDLPSRRTNVAFILNRHVFRRMEDG